MVCALKSLKTTYILQKCQLITELYKFMTFLRVRLKNQEEALFLGEHLLQDKDLSLIGISKVDFQEAWEVFKKYKHLSFTDATTLVIMKRYSITHLCSFDSDFDTFRKIERVH